MTNLRVEKALISVDQTKPYYMRITSDTTTILPIYFKVTHSPSFRLGKIYSLVGGVQGDVIQFGKLIGCNH